MSNPLRRTFNGNALGIKHIVSQTPKGWLIQAFTLGTLSGSVHTSCMIYEVEDPDHTCDPATFVFS